MSATIDLWHRISLAGVGPDMEEPFRRKIVLTNQISALAGVAVLVANLVGRIAVGGQTITLGLLLLGVAGYFVIPLLNHARRHELARVILTLLPPIHTILDAGLVTDGPAISPKFALLSVIVVPALIYGIEEPRKMFAGIAWVAATFVGMDALMPIIPTPPGTASQELNSPTSIAVTAALSIVMFTLSFIYSQRLSRAAEYKLEIEQAKSEHLLLNILPKDIAAARKHSDRPIAERFDDTSVLFADIVGFTPLAAGLTPDVVVDLLNDLFSAFDRMVESRDLEKIKTIGDCYMVAAGVPRPRGDHAGALVQLALAMQDHMKRTPVHGKTIELRIGIHSGPVTAGVIGRTKFIYDLWGDTVNTASRMESQGRAGTVQITEATHALLADEFICSPGGMIDIKGKGAMNVWYVLGARTRDPPDRRPTATGGSLVPTLPRPG